MDAIQLGTQDLYALGFRFKVIFQYGENGSAQNFDMVFQKVSGLGVKRSVANNEGGGKRVGPKNFSNLTLIKGLSIQKVDLWESFRETVFAKHVRRINAVLVSLMDERGEVTRTWKLHGVTPVGWSISDLDATNSSILMETIELSYQNMQFF